MAVRILNLCHSVFSASVLSLATWPLLGLDPQCLVTEAVQKLAILFLFGEKRISVLDFKQYLIMISQWIDFEFNICLKRSSCSHRQIIYALLLSLCLRVLLSCIDIASRPVGQV